MTLVPGFALMCYPGMTLVPECATQIMILVPKCATQV